MKAAETPTTAVVFMTADQDFRAEVESLLGDIGYRLRTADSLEDLVAGLEDEHPRLVLIDLDMPAMPKGIRATTIHLREETKLGDVPIVYLSIEKELKIVSESLLLGRNEYIIRVAKPAQLKNLLHQLLPRNI